MTTPEPWSGRRSGRVTTDSGPYAEFAALHAHTAPESMTPPRHSATPASERIQRTRATRLDELVSDLSDRDWAILHSLADYGFLTTTQLELLHFPDHRTTAAAQRICRRVLSRLRADRLIEPLERRIGGLRAGSTSYIWRLAAVGDRAIRATEANAPRARRKEPSLRFLEHRLLVADAACQLTEAARAGRFELLQIVPEPANWRTYPGVHGTREVLKPDLYVTTAKDDFTDSWMFEVDRATESTSTVLKKCAQYERYRRTGREQAETGVFPRVLWTVPDERRAEQLRGAIRRTRSLDPSLFRVTLHSDVARVVAEGAA